MRSFKIRFLILAAMAFIIFLFCSKNSMNVIEEKIPSQWNDGGLFSKHYNLAYNVMKTMTLDEKIGQILLVRLPSSNVEKVIDKYKIGGFVFYHKDISKHSKKSLSDLIKEYNNEADLPLIIAIDEEGGSVVRLSNNKSFRSEPFKSPQRIFEESGYEGIVNTTKEMCDLLGGIGFNLNLAPVADISVNPKDYIYHRSFGKPAKETAEFVNCIIKTSQGSKLSFAMKHFPGYGSNHDTHKGMVVDNRSLDEIKSNDLLPFKSGVVAGADSIMVSHNIVACLDMSMPASLSKKVHIFAREQLKFSGIIMTDNVDMQGIRTFTDGTGVIEAILAGNDIVMVTDYKKSIKEIKQALKSGKLTQEMIDYMVFRVLAWKYYKGLFES